MLHAARLAAKLRLAIAAAALLGLAWPAAAGETLDGPLRATVENVVDGDTLAVRVQVWIGLELTVLVRLRGIDAPEKRGRCPAERKLAEAATRRLADLVADGAVTLRGVEADKSAGRVVADVATPDGRSPAAALVAAGLARPYDGGSRAPWCDTAGRLLAGGAAGRV